jgi:hypothetical protein
MAAHDRLECSGCMPRGALRQTHHRRVQAIARPRDPIWTVTRHRETTNRRCRQSVETKLTFTGQESARASRPVSVTAASSYTQGNRCLATEQSLSIRGRLREVASR